MGSQTRRQARYRLVKNSAGGFFPMARLRDYLHFRTHHDDNTRYSPSSATPMQRGLFRLGERDKFSTTGTRALTTGGSRAILGPCGAVN